jgi:two-component system cell cycle response regulator DivK
MFGSAKVDIDADVTHQGTEMTTKAERPRVLLVDDYPDAREMYTEYLEFSGFDVVQASNGMEALERAADAAPDIILMDLSLPVMDGWEATRRLKADARTASIPVVALTGHALAGISEGAKRAGCDAFVTKPCLPEDLVSEIRRILDGKSSTTKSPRNGKFASTGG